MQVSVLGCGWLGFALARGLLTKGYTIKGSTTTGAKLEVLRDAGVDPYLVNLESPKPETLSSFLHSSEVLVINIPPKIKDATVTYPDKMRFLVPYIEAAGIKKVVFVSSTSVYADAFPFPVITEETPPNPQTESARQILQAEQVLQNNPAFKTTILRLSGLVGESRHPVYHLAGRQGVENPDGPINLVDLATATYSIYRIMEVNAWGEVFLAADKDHTTRKEFYTARAKALFVEPPQFNHDVPSVGKIISSAKAQRILDVSFYGVL